MNNCRKEKIWNEEAIGANKPGSKINGNFTTSVLEGSFVKYLNGVGVESTAISKIFSSNKSCW